MTGVLKRKVYEGFPGDSAVETLPANAGDPGLIPDLGRSHVPSSNKAGALQLLSLCSRAWEQQRLSPMCNY